MSPLFKVGWWTFPFCPSSGSLITSCMLIAFNNHIPVQLTVYLTLRFKNSPYKDHCAHNNQARKHAYRAGQKVEPCCRAAKKNSTDEQSNSTCSLLPTPPEQV